ncbi:unnamed protein product, partial [Prorocentrum cordatum]
RKWRRTARKGEERWTAPRRVAAAATTTPPGRQSSLPPGFARTLARRGARARERERHRDRDKEKQGSRGRRSKRRRRARAAAAAAAAAAAEAAGVRGGRASARARQPNRARPAGGPRGGAAAPRRKADDLRGAAARAGPLCRRLVARRRRHPLWCRRCVAWPPTTDHSSKCEVERRRAQHGSTAWSAATLCMASSHVSMPASTQRCHRLWLSPRGSRTAPAASSPAQTEDVHDGPAQVREEHPEQPREHDLHERARGDEEEVGRGHEPEQPAGGETFARSESGAEDQLATAAITQISASPTPRRYTLRAAGMHLNPRAMPTASEAPRSSTTPPRSNRSSRSRRPRRRSGGYGRRQTRTGSSP